MYTNEDLSKFRKGMKRLDEMRQEIREVLGAAFGRIEKILESRPAPINDPNHSLWLSEVPLEIQGDALQIVYRTGRKNPIRLVYWKGDRPYSAVEASRWHELPVHLVPQVHKNMDHILTQFVNEVPELEAEIAFVISQGVAEDTGRVKK